MATSQAAHFVQQKAMGGQEPTSTSVKDAHATHPDGTPVMMKALTWQGNQSVKLQEVPKPAVTDAQDIVIKVTGTTICGSDLHLYRGGILQMQTNDVLGHECVGIVESVGDKVTKVKPGDRVVPSFAISCGQCHFCKKGLPTACETTNSSSLQHKLYGHKITGVQGYSHFTGGYAGMQAEFCRIPYADTNVLKIPKSQAELPDEKVIFLSDIIPTAFHAIASTSFKKEQSATTVVFGAGPIGLTVAQWLKTLGAKRIMVLDSVPERLTFAKDVLGVETLNVNDHGSTDGASKKLLELEPHGWDYVYDCAGFRYAKNILHKAMRALNLETDTPEILNAAVRIARPFGEVSLIADYVGITHGFNIGALMEKGVKLVGCGQAPVINYQHKILHDYILPGHFDSTLLLTHRFQLEDMPVLYEAFDRKRSTYDKEASEMTAILKTFVQTKHSAPPAPGTPQLSKPPSGGLFSG